MHVQLRPPADAVEREPGIDVDFSARRELRPHVLALRRQRLEQPLVERHLPPLDYQRQQAVGGIAVAAAREPQRRRPVAGVELLDDDAAVVGMHDGSQIDQRIRQPRIVDSPAVDVASGLELQRRLRGGMLRETKLDAGLCPQRGQRRELLGEVGRERRQELRREVEPIDRAGHAPGLGGRFQMAFQHDPPQMVGRQRAGHMHDVSGSRRNRVGRLLPVAALPALGGFALLLQLRTVSSNHSMLLLHFQIQLAERCTARPARA